MQNKFLVTGIGFLFLAAFLFLTPFIGMSWVIIENLMSAITHFWGISYFAFPLLALYIGIFVLRGNGVYYFINQSLKIISFFAIFFLINMCLLNIPAFFSGSWSGLLPMIVHVLFVNLLGEKQVIPSWKTLSIEILLILSYLIIWFQEKISKFINEVDMKTVLKNVKEYFHTSKLFLAQVWEREKQVGAVLKKVNNEEMARYYSLPSNNPFYRHPEPQNEALESLGNNSFEELKKEKQNLIIDKSSDENSIEEENPNDILINLSKEENPNANRPLLADDLDESSQTNDSTSMGHETLRENLNNRIDVVTQNEMRNGYSDHSEEDVDFDLSSSLMGKEMKMTASKREDEKENLNPQTTIIDPEKRPVVLNSQEKAYFKNDSLQMTAKPDVLEYSEFIMRGHDFEESIRHTAKKLEKTIKEFAIEAKVVEVSSGPVITQYEITIEAGVKISKVVNLADNIALSLAAPSVRIVAPIPGKGVIGIEIPNQKRQMVRLRDVVESDLYRHSDNALPIALGKSILGESVIKDIATTPHLLVAGATGSGKSVCVNSIITSLLIKRSPDEVRFIMIDPKMVELNVYNGIPHLLAPVITDPKKASLALRWVIAEMESRYYLLEKYGARSISSYNAIIKNKIEKNEFIEDNLGTLPYIVLIIDEFADLMMIAKKEVEDSVSRLAAMSRAVGIHLILATQRPSVDVITGVIKANFPSRIAFQVSSKIDSRTIIDANGADQLLGKGDMLYTDTTSPFPERIQGAFLSDEEVGNIVKDLKSKGGEDYLEDIFTIGENTDKNALDEIQDDLFDEAVWVIINDKKASASYLQRKLKIGYNRAARIIEKMEEVGVVGPADGSRPREVLVSSWQGINTLKASVVG